ncbi:Rossmann-fold NAD(P)-binding domain-containing protein [Flocculibacter collagenilyticus]|uniref:hypothetical protein n=1 Tax=Flocculibacter collagenilyticus TaxID=2744479 RepID=UPI0018F2B474|nr:hypothetical protein [Flocculibacter collagenilyticus]
MALNILSTFFCSKASVNRDKVGGSITNVPSTALRTCAPFECVDDAESESESDEAMDSVAKGLALELVDRSISVIVRTQIL